MAALVPSPQRLRLEEEGKRGALAAAAGEKQQQLRQLAALRERVMVAADGDGDRLCAHMRCDMQRSVSVDAYACVGVTFR